MSARPSAVLPPRGPDGRPLMIDMKGRVYGQLTVLAFAPTVGKRVAHWLCRCTCGTRKVICGNSLRRGITRSCGCLIRIRASERGKKIPRWTPGQPYGVVCLTWTPPLQEKRK